MATSTPTIRSRWLGNAMLRARKGAGLTLDQAAARIGWQGSKISRVENGLVRVHWGDIQDLLDAYEVADEALRASLITLAKSLKEQGWWRGHGATLSHPYADFLSLEGTARDLSVYQPQVIPGLLQTRGYAMAMVGSSKVWESPEEVEQFVQIRTSRRVILTRPSPVQLWAVVGEAALRQRLGGHEVMKEQLEHLIQMAALPSVTLQVLPFTAEAATGMFGPFTLLSFADPVLSEVVFLENLVGGLYLEQQDEIGQYRLAYNHLRASASPPRKSVQLIRDVLEELTEV
ncbi:helix-turn-helix domain-containing protein [Actinomadura sp. 9N407]|uniref:helix-turn-helix domain-containing protein n=1 Tax=Actinomadura sp. 9N407 TaxID=3375154 RepID=UPI0037B5AD2F